MHQRDKLNAYLVQKLALVVAFLVWISPSVLSISDRVARSSYATKYCPLESSLLLGAK